MVWPIDAKVTAIWSNIHLEIHRTLLLAIPLKGCSVCWCGVGSVLVWSWGCGSCGIDGSFFPPKSCRKMAGRKLGREIDSLIWREEIGNRNRLSIWREEIGNKSLLSPLASRLHAIYYYCYPLLLTHCYPLPLLPVDPSDPFIIHVHNRKSRSLLRHHHRWFAQGSDRDGIARRCRTSNGREFPMPMHRRAGRRTAIGENSTFQGQFVP